MSTLHVSGLAKWFGRTNVLAGLDLTVPDGQVAAVLGPSGCGKSTLLRLVAGFERADAGEIEIGGTRVATPGTHVRPERRRVGIVPQEGALFPHLSVADNVAFGLPRAERRDGARVREVLELVGLTGYRDRMPHELSGGQQQRVALARALAPCPALVLLDEPFNALDPALRASLRQEVRTVLHEAGATAMLVTHDQEEALAVADLVALLRDGRIVQAGPPRTVYERPRDVATAGLLGETVLLPGVRVDDGAVRCALGVLTTHGDGARATVAAGEREANGSAALNGSGGGHGTGGSIGSGSAGTARTGAAAPTGAAGRGTVVLRPEQLVLDPLGEVRAEVKDTRFLGHDTVVRLALPANGSNSGTEISARLHAYPPPRAGEVVAVRVAGEVSFFPTAEVG